MKCGNRLGEDDDEDFCKQCYKTEHYYDLDNKVEDILWSEEELASSKLYNPWLCAVPFGISFVCPIIAAKGMVVFGLVFGWIFSWLAIIFGFATFVVVTFTIPPKNKLLRRLLLAFSSLWTVMLVLMAFSAMGAILLVAMIAFYIAYQLHIRDYVKK
jgi:hypothetical protein